MEEIIARRKGGLLAIRLFCAVIIAVFAIGIVIGAVTSGEIYLIIPAGIFFALFGVLIYMVIHVQKIPAVLITYNQGKLYFADGLECTPHELTNVTYKRVASRGIYYSWGTLNVTVNGTEHKYQYMADVVDVHDRLLELMLEAREKN